MSGFRVPHHPPARVAWQQPVPFRFDGRDHRGLAGDTLASALLADGARMLARSFKLGRARGLVGAGAEEPNVLVQLEDGARSVPNLKATQVELYPGLQAARCAGPQPGFDARRLGGLLARFMPAGFYYKTFMAPQAWWPWYERQIRRAAGFGVVPRLPDPDRYDHLQHHVDLLVIGGGACGLQAALQAGRAGLRVLLVDEQSEPGGHLLAAPRLGIGAQAGRDWLAATVAELRSLPNVQLLARCTAFALHDMQLVQAVELLQDHLPLAQRSADRPRERLHRIRAHRLLLATGAIERPLVFGNNDLPGVMTAAAVQSYLNRYGVAAGRRALFLTGNDAAYAPACDLARAGVAVTLADLRAEPGARRRAQARDAGVELLPGHGIARVLGSAGVEAAQLVRLSADARRVAGPGPRWQGDLVASSGGLSPTVHLFCHDGSRPAWNNALQAFVVPEEGRAGIGCAGAVTGTFDLGAALQQTGRVLGRLLNGRAAGSAGSFAGAAPADPSGGPQTEAVPALSLFRVPDGHPEGAGSPAFVDLQNDVTAADIHLALRENYRSVEHLKRYTGLGFGTDQGKLSNVNGFGIAAEALGQPVGSLGTTTYRPAYTPVSFGALAGAHQGSTFEPYRCTPMHACHQARGAVFEPVGQWLRPRYFAQPGEDMQAAVDRECRAARNGVALMDASTLGKIDLQGADAREFLNRVYSNAWSQLAPGKCRYGLMLDDNGMVIDDGVTACVDDRHFLMTTTTGGAARVLRWLELWHQTEWPELRVFMTSVTDHWCTSAVVGPGSRAVLARLCTDIDLSPQAFGFMDWREGTVAGVPARVFRISFSGELAYEVNVEAGSGAQLWEALMEAGRSDGIVPYGTEAMHVLRAEKGFIIVGQDTDGSVTPLDLGMDWAVGHRKPFSFIGRRALARPEMQRADRRQLVGLLTTDPDALLAEGAQIVEQPVHAASVRPVPMLGHVTSAYRSAALGRSIALALVAGGRARHGSRLHAFSRGHCTEVQVVPPVFFDPEGRRHHV